MMKVLFLMFCTIQFLSSTEIYPEKLETIIKSTKHIHNIKFTFRRHSRNSPYYIDFDYIATSGYGNNLTLKWQLNEYISGRFVAVPVQFEYKLCDFLYKDPFFGQMYAKQLAGNWSCPFPPTCDINQPALFLHGVDFGSPRGDLCPCSENILIMLWNYDFIGRSPFRSLVMHIENMPRVPFTYSSLIVRTRADLTIFMLEEVALVKIYLTVRQTLKKIDMKTWNGTILANHTFA